MAKVKISDGILEGEKIENEYGGTYYSFKGIPYAKPPLGDLRFKAPQPVEPWNGIRHAKKCGPASFQYDIFISKRVLGQEDCLYLNVYTPDITPKQPFPVMVWIHGGGFVSGSGDDFIYGPEFLVKKDVILVTFNYRLGVPGFLCLDTEDIPGNAGMKDQVAVLRWVKNNIEKFGGDSNNVTIFGESAGGMSVSYHLISPMSAGLFKRAIAQSGAFTCWWGKGLRPRDRALVLAKRLGCYTENDKELTIFFISQPIESFTDTKLTITASESFFEKFAVDLSIVSEKKFGNNERFFFYEDILPTIHPDVEIITGYCEHEGILSLMFDINTLLQQANFYPEFFVPKPIAFESPLTEQLEIGKRIKKFYFHDDKISIENIEKLVDYFSMDMFSYGAIVLARVIAASENNKAFLYKFTCKSKRNIFTKNFVKDNVLKDKIFVCHADDLGYIFPMRLLQQNINTNSKEYQMIETVTMLWTNFAKFGCPTPDTSLGAKWLPYTKENKNYLNIGEKLVASENPQGEEINFWDKIYAHYFPQYTF